ncbi:PIR protein CIR protein [Plasmodium vinckei vinckei]|uniref:PIR protein CIR protein n=1 Tax=Plasmodium vinckei vinckei TaxID=54757 RepID=A0A449BR08_PLAVN|nr:PIR protein CIR protein [Plasmodium vinckei vinckei]VEV55843.1 PIR protein CIR protein [Plasmodium vinckei vinckei]
MDDKTCDLLSEVDENFNNKGVNVRRFNRFTKCHSYCPYGNICTNDYERVNALGSYLFNEIMKIGKAFNWSDGDKRHIEVFMIWMGDKLFRINNDYKETLEESYKNNLENIMGNVNYWETISKKLYKDATIKKMSEFYSLLNYICKLITEYNKNPYNKNLGRYSSQCNNYYKTIHKSTNECGPYLKLLDSLKMIYEIFRMQKISNNYSIKATEKKLILNRVKSLETFKGENRYLLTVNARPSFDDKECKVVKSNDEEVGKKIALQKSQDPGKHKKSDKGPQTRASENPQRRNPGSPHLKPPPAPRSQPKLEAKQQGSQSQGQPIAPVKPPVPKPPEQPDAQTPGKKSIQPQPQSPTSSQKKEQSSPPGPISKNDPSLQTSKKSEPTHQSGTKDSGSTKGSKGSGANALGGGTSQPGNSEGKPKDDPQKKTDQVDNSSLGPKGSSQSTGVRNQGTGTDSGADGQGKSSDGTGGGTDGHADKDSQGGSGNQKKLSGKSPDGNSVPGQPETAPSGTSTTPSPVSQPPSVPPIPSAPPQQPNSQKPGRPPEIPSKSQTQQKPGQSPSQDDAPLQTPQTGGSSSGNENPGGGPSDPVSNTSGGSFDLGSSILKFLLNGTDKLNKTSQFIQQNQKMFKDAKDKISGAYNDTVENLKNVYNVSSSHFNNIINNITSHLNQVGTPPKSSDKQSGPGSPIDGGNKLNQSPSNSQQNPPPPPPQQPPPPTPPQLPSPPIPTPITLPDPLKGSPQQKQPSSQSQTITQHPPQVPVKVNQPNHKTVVQFVKSLSSDLILKKPWNIFPTTWNGSGDCKPEVNFMNTTLVCCTSEQCSLTGITVTLVLIPIILLIAYKYLSFGSSKKSEKKNMKKVINFHDGKRKTKIIISSNDRSKDLKPVINSIGGKKDSLLNIYKIIQADPMPFINLFFLLIFFVYKRKRDTIE